MLLVPEHTEPAYLELSVTCPLLPVLTLPSFALTDEDMHLWCPSLKEVKEVFHSLGAYNPALYPQGPCQHSSRCVPPLFTAAFSLAYKVGATAQVRMPTRVQA